MRKHVLILTLLIGLVSLGTVLLFLNFSLTPVGASLQSQPIDTALKILFSIGGVIFALVTIILLYSVAVFRRRRGDMGDGPPIFGNTTLEAAWTLVPLAIVMSLGVYGVLLLQDISAPPHDQEELEVQVTAAQWAWSFHYPEYGVTSSQLQVPQGRPILFKITSRDVIHSFWVPEWRVKQDAVPGMETRLRITPTRIGVYKVECAELCGLAHAYMVTPANVVSEADFMQWIESQKRQ